MIFDDLIGNETVKQQLLKAIENKSINNTLFFSGPSGIGKSLFAKYLSAILMYGFDVDKSVLEKIISNNHPDLHLFIPEGKTAHHSIASIRELIEQVFMAPFEAKSKVFIIEEAHRMLLPSSNALLKTLEEPTLDSYIILISHKPQEILSTILSRCFKVNFNYIKQEEISSFLLKKHSLSQEEAQKLAQIAFGSIGRALELANHPDYLNKRQLFISILSKENINTYYDLSTALSKLEDIYIKSFSKEGDMNFLYKEVDLLLEKLFYWFRDLHLLKISSETKHLYFLDKMELLQKQNLETLPSLDLLSSLIIQAKEALARNIKLKHVLENLFLQIEFV